MMIVDDAIGPNFMILQRSYLDRSLDVSCAIFQIDNVLPTILNILAQLYNSVYCICLFVIKQDSRILSSSRESFCFNHIVQFVSIALRGLDQGFYDAASLERKASEICCEVFITSLFCRVDVVDRIRWVNRCFYVDYGSSSNQCNAALKSEIIITVL